MPRRCDMNDINIIVGYIITALAMATTIFLYVLVTQAVNDMTCAAMDRSATPIIGKWFIKALALCWL